MSTKVYEIKNQTQAVNTGTIFRRLVIDTESNHPRPVWRSDRSNGRSPSAGTYQNAKPGDIVITVTINPMADVKIALTFCMVNEQGLTEPVESGFNFYPVINSINTLVREWLYEPTSQPYLPKGVGWDGETPEIEKIKMERAWGILPRGIPSEYLDDLHTAISYTSVNVFKNIDTITLNRSNVVDIPNGDIIIRADKDNKCINVSKPLYDGLTIPLTLSDDTHRVYIINYVKLQGNSCNKIAIELVEFI
jgi:hypothetical protein